MFHHNLLITNVLFSRESVKDFLITMKKSLSLPLRKEKTDK